MNTQLVTHENGVTALECLAKIAENPNTAADKIPDLILLDLNMPKIDGRDVLSRIRHLPVLHWVPVVIFSGSTDKGDCDGSYEAGANSYVVKPFGFEPLVRVLRDLKHYWVQVNTDSLEELRKADQP